MLSFYFGWVHLLRFGLGFSLAHISSLAFINFFFLALILTFSHPIFFLFYLVSLLSMHLFLYREPRFFSVYLLRSDSYFHNSFLISSLVPPLSLSLPFSLSSSLSLFVFLSSCFSFLFFYVLVFVPRLKQMSSWALLPPSNHSSWLFPFSLIFSTIILLTIPPFYFTLLD